MNKKQTRESDHPDYRPPKRNGMTFWKVFGTMSVTGVIMGIAFYATMNVKMSYAEREFEKIDEFHKTVYESVTQQKVLSQKLDSHLTAYEKSEKLTDKRHEETMDILRDIRNARLSQ